MLKIAICDDDNTMCSLVESYIIHYGKANFINLDIGIFYQGEHLLKFIENDHSFDLIFLDIELGTTTGIVVGTKIREEFDDHISKIVFMTSKNGYESKLFDIQPLNFLRKPIDTSKLQKCLDVAIKILGIENKTFEYKKGVDVIKVSLKDILYFVKVGKKIKIVTMNGEDFFLQTLDGIQNKLPEIFIEPHGSYLVNFEKIIRSSKDKLIMVNKIEIPVSQRNLANIRAMLLKSEREKKNVTL